MSITVDWIALRAASQAEALERLGLEDTGETAEDWTSPISCVVNPAGWLIIAATDRKFDVEAAMEALSPPGLAMSCEMSEVVMYSRAIGYLDGRRIWTVTHDPDEDVEDVAVEGDPPVELSNILNNLKAQRETDPEVDFVFDAPMELTAGLCGFRPDNDETQGWRILRRRGGALAAKASSGRSGGWLSRLFGR